MIILRGYRHRFWHTSRAYHWERSLEDQNARKKHRYWKKEARLSHDVIRSEFSWLVFVNRSTLWYALDATLSRSFSFAPRRATTRYNSSVFLKLPTSEWIWAIALLFRSGKTVKRPPRTVKPFVRGETRVCTKKCGGGGTERNLIVDFVFLSEPSVFFCLGCKNRQKCRIRESEKISFLL